MAEDLLYYVDRRSKLDVALKEGVPFAPTYSGLVGLINQGSNAFNSLIQCLFYNVPFRNLILNEISDTPIFKAIQETFCYLQLSESCAVRTNELVSAFRWSRGEAFEQHDVHELFGLVLDSLGDEVPDLRVSLSKLFRGSLTSTTFVLMCASSSFPFIIFLIPSRRCALLSNLLKETRNRIIFPECFFGIGSLLFYWQER